MTDAVELGPVPSDEQCEQLGEDYDARKAKAQCRAFAHQLARMFGEPPEGARFAVTSNRHDFGTYYEVAVKYDGNNQTAAAYAYRVDEGAPTRWDRDALLELAEARA